MNVADYLKRINYVGSVEPCYATLRALQVAHLQAVPFENLDIHLGQVIKLDLPLVFDKIVVRHRGGFCYELNGLFAWLLQCLGFEVTYLSASDAHDDDRYGPEFDHLALCVRAPQDRALAWLTDVGWGDTFLEPLKLGETTKQTQAGRAYRIDRDGDYHVLWQRGYDGQWERQYRFTLQPRAYQDFAPMCHYHQTSPESLFVKKRLCTMVVTDGRTTLDNLRLIRTVHGQRQEQLIAEESYRDMLSVHFGIEI